MKIALLYVAVTNGAVTKDFAARFVGTMAEHPAGAEHDTFICCNGGPLDRETATMFTALHSPSVRFFPRQNTPGFDIAAYIEAAKGPAKDYDALICCGESVYFHRAGWLARLVEAWKDFGPGIYGPFASYNVRAHLNTTCFMTTPKLLSGYPLPVSNHAERYGFEHGEDAFWRQAVKGGSLALLVTWDGVWLPQQWRKPKNILWRGDQSNCLAKCSHTDRWAAASPLDRTKWSNSADSQFR